MRDRSMTVSRVAIGVCAVAGVLNAVQSQFLLAGLCLVLVLMLAPAAFGRSR